MDRSSSSTREEMEHGVSTAIATNSDVRKRSTNFGREMLNATVSAWTLLARTFLQIALAQYRKALLLDQFNSSKSSSIFRSRTSIKGAVLAALARDNSFYERRGRRRSGSQGFFSWPYIRE